MNAPFTPSPTIDSFHAGRSKCIDAFASVEEVVVALLVMLEIKIGAEPFGQKIEQLRKAKASPRFSKARLEKLSILLPGCETLNSLRNDIVHSRLQVVVIEEYPRACFINTRECLSGSQSARIFSYEGLLKLRADIAKMAVELNQVLINPASSPQPPSLVAAGDP